MSPPRLPTTHVSASPPGVRRSARHHDRRPAVWSLEASNGTTMVWFDGDYRYELFGRSYVARRPCRGWSSTSSRSRS